MANPCAFSYVDKDGNTVTFSTKEEFAKALYDGLLDEFVNEKKIGNKSAKVLVEKSAMQDLKNQAIDIFKAGLEAAKTTKATSKAKLKSIADVINSLVKDENGKTKKGFISQKQANTLIQRIANVNLDNKKTTEKLLDYADKLFTDAEHKDVLDNLKNTISGIKKKLSLNSIDAEIKQIAKDFANIKLSNVKDIEKHIEIANAINEGLKPSKISRDELTTSKVIDKKSVSEYVSSELKNQESIDIQNKINEFHENTGLNPADFSYEDIEAILNDQKEISETPYSEPKIKSKLKKAYDSLVSITQDGINTGIDIFTGEKITFPKEIIDSFEKLKNIDFDLLSNKDALSVIDVLNDIAVNGKSNKVDLFLKKYEGVKDAYEFAKGESASKLKLFFSDWAGEFWNKQVGSLYSVAETMFRGFEKGNDFMKAMGFDKIQKGATIAEMKVNQSFSKYSNKYLETSPNKQGFNTEYNNTERTFLAMAKRFTPGQETDDFFRNKSLIEQSIAVLSEGSDLEKKSAEIQKEVYEKLFKNSVSKEDVISKADKINSNAVSDMSSYHKENFIGNADSALKYYNTVLTEDENYNTIKYSRLSGEKNTIDSDGFDSAIVNKESKVYDKKTGVFNELNNPATLRKGTYINTMFEVNNEQAMKSALIDANTAGDIQSLKAFVYSDYFKYIIQNKRDRDLFIDRLKTFVDIKRGRNYPPIGKEEISFINKATRTISRIGSVKVLGGIMQLPKQTVSVGASTLINSGRLSVVDAFDPKWNDFINNSGYEIATRGIHSSSDFVAIQDILRSVENSKVKQTLDKLEKVQGVYLKWFLAKPDVFIAKASWISYYKEGLKKQGINPDGIDISSHKINDDAAFYAQRQVDRQQNVSDTALEGKWLTSKDPSAELSRAVLLPFAKFALNQKSRMYSDFHTVFNKNATSGDRSVALKSLVALSAEQAIFRAISTGISVGIYSGVSALMGHEESEEDKDKRIKKTIENQLRSSVADYGSPLPFLDYPTQYAAGKLVNGIQDLAGVEKDSKLNLVPYMDMGYADRFGMYGVVAKGGNDLYNFQNLAWTGKYTENGEEKELSIDKQNALRIASAGNLMYHLGFLPSEFNVAFKDLEKISKKEDTSNEGGRLFKNKKSLFSGGSLFKNKKSLFK